MQRRSFSLNLASLALSGCAGYTLGPTKPANLTKIRRIAVPTFVNDTLEPRLQVITTNTIIKRLQMDGAYEIVSRDQADAILKGVILTVERRQARFARNESLASRELRINLRVQFELEERVTGIILLKGAAVGTSNIIIGTDFAIAETQALADAAERLSISLVSQLTTGWE